MKLKKIKGGVTDPDPAKQLPINGLLLVSESATVGTWCFTPPKRAFNRKIKDTCFCLLFVLDLTINLLYIVEIQMSIGDL
jgi:hypothetical protein